MSPKKPWSVRAIERQRLGAQDANVEPFLHQRLSRLTDSHTPLIPTVSHKYAENADDAGSSGNNDLLVTRANEPRVWFLSGHLAAATPL